MESSLACTAAGACLPGTSPAQLNRLVFREAGGVTQSLIDIRRLQVGISAQNRLPAFPFRQQTKQPRHREAQIAYARLARSHRRVNRDSLEPHGVYPL